MTQGIKNYSALYKKSDKDIKFYLRYIDKKDNVHIEMCVS